MSDDGTLFIPRGFRASGVTAGLKASGLPDLALLASDQPCAAAGTFTLNRVCAAPVKWCRERLPADDIRAVVINSGNANAATFGRITSTQSGGDAIGRSRELRFGLRLGF